MKFRRLIFVVIIVIVLIAWFTKPNLQDFNDFYLKQRTDKPVIIDLSDQFLYSTVDVSWYVAAQLDPSAQAAPKAVVAGKEKYLGLFGRFWKL